MEIKRKALFTQFLIVLANVNKFSYSGEESRKVEQFKGRKEVLAKLFGDKMWCKLAKHEQIWDNLLSANNKKWRRKEEKRKGKVGKLEVSSK